MRRALSEYVVTGIRTNLAFHEKLFAHPEFAAGRYDTGFIERYKDELLHVPAGEARAARRGGRRHRRRRRAHGARDGRDAGERGRERLEAIALGRPPPRATLGVA